MNLISVTALFLCACVNNAWGMPNAPSETKNIVEVATSKGFKTLVSLLSEADLAETLQSEGPFTVFAPTDEAFASLPPFMLEGIKMKKELLKTILLGHVVSGKVLSSDLNDGMMADTLVPGLQLEFKINLNGAVVNDANIKLVDVEASNGVIHVIDKVLLPPSGDSTKMSPMKNIVEVAISHGFKTLVSLLTKADLADTLQGEGPFTVFAPTDEAFANLPSHILEGIKTNKDHLKDVLLAHVVSGKMLSKDFIDGMTSNTLLENFNLLLTISMNGLAVNGGNVILGDVEASNGVIHVINKVILPKKDGEEATPGTETDPKPYSKAEPEPEPYSKAEPEPEPYSKAEPEPEPEPYSKAEPEPEPYSKAEPEPEPYSKAEPETEPNSESEPEA